MSHISRIARRSRLFAVGLALCAGMALGQPIDVLDVQIGPTDPAASAVDVTGGAASATVLIESPAALLFVGEPFPPGRIELTSPNGQQTASGWLFTLDPVSGLWQGEVWFPPGAEAGTWTVSSLALSTADATVSLTPQDFAANGWTSTVDVDSDPAFPDGDAPLPDLSTLAVAPAQFVGDRVQRVGVRLDVADEPLGAAAGVAGITATFVDRWSSAAPAPTLTLSDFRLEAGTPLAGTWSGTLAVPPSVDWNWQRWELDALRVEDRQGNAATLTAQDIAAVLGSAPAFEVEAPQTVPVVDSTGPTLDASRIYLEPAGLDADQGQTAKVTLHLRDDIAGVSFTAGALQPLGIVLRPPSDPSLQSYSTTFRLVSGDAWDGWWQAELSFPAVNTETWTVASLLLADAAGNLTQADVSAFPGIEVRSANGCVWWQSPTLEAQGTAPAAGQVNVSAGVGRVVIDLHVLDASGPLFDGSSGVVEYRSPSGAATVLVTAFQLVSGTPVDGIWRGTAAFPPLAEAGTWTAHFSVTNVCGGNWLWDQAVPALDIGVISSGGTVIDDTTPPALVQGSLYPTQVDVAAGPADIRLSVRLTDDLAGVPDWLSTVNLYHTVTGQTLYGQLQRASGDGWDGWWEATFTLPQGSPSGDWQLSWIGVNDNVNNGLWYDPTTVLPRSVVTVTGGIVDTTPPALGDLGIEYDPAATLDTATGQVAVDIRLHIREQGAGLAVGCSPNCTTGLTGQSPVGQSSWGVYDWTDTGTTDANGDAIWTGTLRLPRYAPAGDWRPRLYLLDKAGNSVFYSAADLAARGVPTLQIVSSAPDSTPPTLTGLNFGYGSLRQKFIDTTQADEAQRTIEIDLAAADFPAGVAYAWLYFRSPVHGQYQYVFASPGQVSRFAFPRWSEAGTWRLESVQVHDRTGNWVNKGRAELEAMGLPTRLNLVQLSHVADGTLTPPPGDILDAPATVEDQDTCIGAGACAEVTLPTGTATGGVTDVEIDVLPITSSLPAFHAPGTAYVSFLFDPDPTYPLPAPGATVVLPVDPPLVAPFPVIKLGYYDPATNATTFANDIYTGAPYIYGSVSPDGRLVTFAHVSHFSTVVGLAEDAEAPQVSAPASISIDASEDGGARGANVAALAAFLAGGSAVDNLDPAPERLAPQADGVDVDNNSLFPAGATTVVTFRYRDAAGNTGSAEASVTVAGIADVEPPTVTAPAAIEIDATEAGGARGSASPALASFLDGGSAEDATDPDPARLAPLADGVEAGYDTLFPVGDTTVTFRFRDASGNLGSAESSVRVRPTADTVPPAVQAPASIEVAATEAGGTRGASSPALAAFLAGGSATDAVDPAPERLSAQANGADVDANTLFPLGTTTVTFRFRDASDNLGSATATVTVADKSAPAVAVPADIEIPATDGQGTTAAASAVLATFLAGGSADDDVDPAPQMLAARVAGADVTAATRFPVGTTTVTFRARDASGNIGSAEARVRVILGAAKLTATVTGKGGTGVGGGYYVDVAFQNTGTGHLRGATVSRITVKGLAGTGSPSLISVPPLAIGDLAPGAAVTLRLSLSVPAGVTRFSVAESGSFKDVAGKTMSFSTSQAVIR